MKELEHQPPPNNKGVEVYPYVTSLIKARVAQQEERHGCRLATNNGRDALFDALQEAIDCVFYLAQAIMERENDRRA